MESSETIWSIPHYEISKPPALGSTLKVLSDPKSAGNFPRAAKWSPDGSVILAQCENASLQMFDVPTQDTADNSSGPSRVFAQAAPVLDFIWYPTASPRDPATFCFVASVRECPVKLLDGSDGRLRASYRIVDHRERQVAPHSLAFNLTAQKLYCGFEDAIEVFDISRPGEGTRVPTTPSKKSKDGLKGIISALAFSPSYSHDEAFYAAGSLASASYNIALFSDEGTEPLMFVGGGPQAGVTQLQFNPVKPHILYATYRGRESGSVYSWDIRSNVDTPLEVFQTPSAGTGNKTNQKIKFDIDLAGRFLSIGDQQGEVFFFDLNSPDGSRGGSADPQTYMPDASDETKITHPTSRFQAHDDAVGSVAFHPLRSFLLSASGSRHFEDESSDEDLEEGLNENSSSNDLGTKSQHSKTHLIRRRGQPMTFDSTIKIWDLKGQR